MTILRDATPEETTAWLGNGRVIFGMQRPQSSQDNSDPQQTTEQDFHDKQLADMSKDQMKKMASNLHKLALSKVMSEPSSLVNEQQPKS